MKKILTAALLTVFCAAAAFAAPEYTIKVGYISSDAHPTMVSMREYFAAPVEKLSGGRIKVELYPNAQLGGDRELCEAVQMGTI